MTDYIPPSKPPPLLWRDIYLYGAATLGAWLGFSAMRDWPTISHSLNNQIAADNHTTAILWLAVAVLITIYYDHPKWTSYKNYHLRKLALIVLGFGMFFHREFWAHRRDALADGDSTTLWVLDNVLAWGLSLAQVALWVSAGLIISAFLREHFGRYTFPVVTMIVACVWAISFMAVTIF